MKQSNLIIATIILIGLSTKLWAQNESGKIYLSILNFDLTSNVTNWKTNTNSGEYSKAYGFGLNPEMGIFIVPNLATGIEIPIRYNTSTDLQNFTTKLKLISFGPYIRFYLGNRNLRPYLHIGTGLGSGSSQVFNPYGGSHVRKGNTSFLDISAGFALYLSKRFSLNIVFKYLYTNLKIKGDYLYINGSQKEKYAFNSNDAGLHIGLIIFL